MSPVEVKKKPPPALDQKAAWIGASGGELEISYILRLIQINSLYLKPLFFNHRLYFPALSRYSPVRKSLKQLLSSKYLVRWCIA